MSPRLPNSKPLRKTKVGLCFERRSIIRSNPVKYKLIRIDTFTEGSLVSKFSRVRQPLGYYKVCGTIRDPCLLFVRKGVTTSSLCTSRYRRVSTSGVYDPASNRTSRTPFLPRTLRRASKTSLPFWSLRPPPEPNNLLDDRPGTGDVCYGHPRTSPPRHWSTAFR